MNKIFYVLVLIVLFFSQDKRLILKHADNAFYDKKNGVERFTGNVKFVKDTLGLEATKILRYRNRNLVQLFGGIKITSGKYQEIYAQNGNYFQLNELVKLYHKVRIYDKKTKTFGDTVFYFKKTDITEIFGNSQINDIETNTDISGNYIRSEQKNIIHVFGDAELNQPEDSLQIFSDTLIINKLIDKSFALGNVKIYQNDVYSEGNFTEFNHTDSTMTIVGKGHLTFEKNDITGDSIYITFKNKSVHKIDIIGNAQALSYSEEHQKNNKFKGKELYMIFDNKKLENIKILHNAISVFYLEDKAGVNSITTDSIKIFFKDSKVDHIRELGSTIGTFYPAGYSGKIKNED